LGKNRRYFRMGLGGEKKGGEKGLRPQGWDKKKKGNGDATGGLNRRKRNKTWKVTRKRGKRGR